MIYKSPRCFLPSFKSIDFSVQEKKRKIDFDFQDGYGGHLGFLIGYNLASFDLQITRKLPSKLKVNCPFNRTAANENPQHMLYVTIKTVFPKLSHNTS